MSYDPFFNFLPQRDVGQDLDWRLQVESRDGACEQALIQSPAQVAVLKAAETANSLTSLMPRCWNCSFKMLKMPLQCTGQVGGMWDVAWRNYADTLALRRILVSPQNIHTPGSTPINPCNSH